MPERTPPELAQNLHAFGTPAAVDEYSVYRLFREEKELFARYYKPGDSVLDLACGLGRTTVLLHEMGMAVRGIDTSEVFIDIAKRRFPYLDVRFGSFASIEEPDAAFSHVLISHNGLDCAFPESQRVQALRESARVLKPGGTLIYSSHNLKSLRYFSPCYRGRMLWVFQNVLKAFKQRAYVVEEGLYTFYASPDYAIRQTENVGLLLLETVGVRVIGNKRLDACLSPYIYYVFSRPINPQPV